MGPEIVQRYEAAFSRMLRLKLDENHNPIIIPLSKAAFRSYQHWVNKQGVAERIKEAQGALSAAWSKVKGYAIRFALILQLCDPKATAEIDESTMKRGITIAKWFMHEAERLYGGLLSEVDDDDTEKLIAWIEKRGGFVA